MHTFRIGFFVTAVLTLAISLSACDEKGAGSGAQRPAPEVGVVEVGSQNVELTTELPGRTSAYKVAEVRPQVSGIIQKRLFTEGANVEAGDVLYQIDPATYQAAHSRARAELARAEANLNTLRLREERYRDLVDIKAISRQQYDDTKAALKQAKAEIEAARAAVETARINLNYTKVKAPISGRIGRSAVTTGALVTASQPLALATIHQLDPMYVDVTQSTAELLSLKQKLASGQLKAKNNGNMEVGLILESVGEYPQKGTLKFSEVSVEQSTGSVVLRTVFPNPEQMLLPGMFVRAVLSEGVKEDAILVPQQGVARDRKGEAVALVVGEDGKIVQRQLTVDRAVGNQWLVTEGLAVGDRLVVEGSQKVRPGAEPRVVFVEDDKEKGSDAPASAADKSAGTQDSERGGA